MGLGMDCFGFETRHCGGELSRSFMTELQLRCCGGKGSLENCVNKDKWCTWFFVGLCGNVIKNFIFCIQDTSDLTPQLIPL